MNTRRSRCNEVAQDNIPFGESQAVKPQKQPKAKAKKQPSFFANALDTVDYAKQTVGQKIEHFITRSEKGLKAFGHKIDKAAKVMSLRTSKSSLGLFAGKTMRTGKVNNIMRSLPKDLAAEVDIAVRRAQKSKGRKYVSHTAQVLFEKHSFYDKIHIYLRIYRINTGDLQFSTLFIKSRRKVVSNATC